MTLLAAVAHQPSVPEQQLRRLKDRLLAVLRDDRPMAMDPVLTPRAAAITGMTTAIVLYLAFTALIPALSAAARVCVGTFPA